MIGGLVILRLGGCVDRCVGGFLVDLSQSIIHILSTHEIYKER